MRRIVIWRTIWRWRSAPSSVRILAPIPGESVVGIEIPNPRREMVYLLEVIESEAYRNIDSKLTLALGKDIGGTPFATIWLKCLIFWLPGNRHRKSVPSMR